MDTILVKQLFSLTSILVILIAGSVLIPEFSIAVLAGIIVTAAVLTIWYKPEWGVYAIAALYPTISFQFVYGSINVPYVDLLAMFVGLVWGTKTLYLHFAKKERIMFVVSPLMWLMALFIFSAVLSLLNVDSELFGVSLKFIFRPLLFFYLLFVVMPYNIITTKKQLFTVFNIMFVLGQLISLMGLYSVLARQVEGFSRATPVDIFGIWFLGSNHNQIAEALVVLIPVGLLLYWMEKDKDQKTMYLLGTLFMVAINFLTLSRAGWLGVISEVTLIAVLMYKDKLFDLIKSYAFYVAMVALLPFLYLMYKLMTSFVAASSTSNRLALIEIAATLFKEHPLLGVGAGTFVNKVESMHWYMIEFAVALDSHGFLFKVLAEMGIVGALSFLALLGYIVYQLYVHAKSYMRTEYAPVAMGALLMVVGGITFQFFGTSFYTSVLWLPIGIALTTIKFGPVPQK